MEFFGFLLLIGLIYGQAQFLIRVARFPAHLAPLASMLADTLVLYAFAMRGALPAGLIIVIILALIMAVGAVVKARFSDTGKWFTPSLLAFFIIAFAVFLYTRGTMFYIWDEFSHWGVIYRYLMTMQALPKNLNVVVVSYPPFSPIWQYFVAKLVGFSEANAYFAHILIQFTCIIALFPSEKWSDTKKYIPALLAGILSVFVLGFLFQSLYVDLLMALLLAVAFSQVNLEGRNNYVNALMILMASLALTLTKPTGIELALIAITAYLAANIFFSGPWFTGSRPFWQSTWFSTILQAVVIFGITLIVWSGWGRYTKDFDYNKVILQKQSTPVSQEESFPINPDEYIQNLKQQEIELRVNTGIFMQPIITRISLKDILRSFTLQAPYRTKLIAQNYVDTFSNKTFGSSKVTLKWALTAVLILVGLNLLTLLTARAQFRNRYLLVNGLLFAGFLLYAVSLFISYIIIFYPSEAIGVPSLQRYLGSYLLAWGLLNLAVSYRVPLDPDVHPGASFAPWITGVFAAGCLFFLPTQQIIHLPPSPIQEQFEAERAYAKISQVKFKPQDKVYEVYSVMPSNFGFKHYVMRYLLAPTASNNEGWSLGKKKGENDVYSADISPEEWFGILQSQGYTYVLVTQSDQGFWDQYGGLFDQYSTDFSQPQLFKVESDGLHFIPLNQEGQ